MTTFKAITANSTYEDLLDNARERSRTLGRYAAVVDITTYMGNCTRTTVMISTTPIKSFSRGGQFVGLMSQFKDGQPYGDGRPVLPKSAPSWTDPDGDVLPF